MAKHIKLEDGPGTLIAADEIEGVHVLRVKPQFGGRGESRDVSPTSPLPVVDRAPGLSVHRALGLGATAQVVKASAGEVFGAHLSNTGSQGAFVKVYDASTAPGAGAAPVLTLFVPAGGAVSARQPRGLRVSQGICVAATTGAADDDTGAPAEQSILVNLFYR